MPKKETKTEEKVEKEEENTREGVQAENPSEQIAPTEPPISEAVTEAIKTPNPEVQSPISMEPVGDIANTESSPPPTAPTTSPSETLPIDQAGAEKPMQETYPLADEIEKDAVRKRSFFSSLLIFRDKKGKIILLGIIFAVLIALIAATVLNTKNEKLSFISGKNKTRETVSLTPTEAPTPTPTAAAAAIDKGQLSIEVQNGSGESGVAGKMKNLLVEKGYTGTIGTGNADNYDYTQTVIKIKKTKSGIESELRSDISKDYTLAEEGEVLDDESEYDIVIIVGAEEITP